MPFVTWGATATMSRRSRSSRAARSAGRRSFPRSAQPGTLRHAAGDVPPPRPHAGRLHQQDQDREMESAGRDSRPRCHREPSRGSAARAERTAQGGQGRGGAGAIVPPRPVVRRRDGHARDGARQPPADLRDARCRSARLVRRRGRPCLDHGGDRRQRHGRRTVRARQSARRAQGTEPAGCGHEARSKAGTRSSRPNGRACCRGRHWSARPNGSSRRDRSADDVRCAGEAVDEEKLAQSIERAMVEMMEASQELERVATAIAQQADDLECGPRQAAVAARARARPVDSSCRPFRRFRSTEPAGQRRRARAGRRRADHGRVWRRSGSGTRRWPSSRRRKRAPGPARATRSS